MTTSRLPVRPDDKLNHVDEGIDLADDVERKRPAPHLLDESAKGPCVLARFVNLLGFVIPPAF